MTILRHAAHLGILGLAFLTAAGAEDAAQLQAPAHTFWKVRTESKDRQGQKVKTTWDGAIIELWRCAAGGVDGKPGLCAALSSVDPKDGAMRKLAAKVLKKDAGAVVDDDVLQFCGYRASLFDMRELPPDANAGVLGKWTGEIDTLMQGLPRQHGLVVKPLPLGIRNLHIDLEDEAGEQIMHARGYVKILGISVGDTVELVGVPNPPAPCIAPQ